MLSELTVDSKTFRYVPAEVLKDLDLYRLNYGTPILLFLEEYNTALATLTSWQKPPASGAVITGHPGNGM